MRSDAGPAIALSRTRGFVCDHVEILYDIDILAQKVAQEKGLCLMRTASLNTSRPSSRPWRW